MEMEESFPGAFSSMTGHYTNSFHMYKPPKDLKCNYYRKHNVTVILYGGYEGLPQNLLLNTVGWLLLLILFAFLRKSAWNYGRIALVQKAEKKWTQLFYGNSGEIPTKAATDEESSVSSLDPSFNIDKGFCSWIVAIFKIKDEQILNRSGRDAIQYLSFQRHIIVYTTIITVISLAVVLPINFQGDLEGDNKSFGHTTISNLNPNSVYLWLHVTLPILFLALGIFIMRRFSVKLKFEQEDGTSVSRTLMITRIPKNMCNKHYIMQHFEEAYPDVEIQDVQFAYDIKKLLNLDKERETSTQAKNFCENYLKNTGVRLEMRPYACGFVCGCCDIFGCPTVDACTYYTEEEARLANEVDTEKVMALRHPLGIAFVTFYSMDMATRVYKDHRQSCKCATNPPTSSLGRDLEPHNWNVSFAPPPEDIYWGNLSVGTEHWYLKAFFINLFLFLVLFFLTTPAIIINSLDMFKLADELQKMNAFVSESAPTLLLWTVAALMPVLVSYSDQWMSHWTRSAVNHSIMQKTFIFLLFMVVILPSLGLTSAKAFVEWAVHSANGTGTYRWECVFLPDNGAFFVNYVITSAFIGTALELIRFPELIMYAIRLCLARSSAETESVRKAILWEFPFGVQYAWMLLIFAMTMIYSISCPLITPFGLVYMLLKHLVDRHNIIFAYGPSKINKQIHATAINFMVVCIILLQLCLLFFSFLRRGLSNITIFSLASFCLSLAGFFAQVFLHWFSGISPISYRRNGNGSSNGILSDSPPRSQSDTDLHRSFLPGVLQNKQMAVSTEDVQESPEKVPATALQKSYGTNLLPKEAGGSPSGSERHLYQDYYGEGEPI